RAGVLLEPAEPAVLPERDAGRNPARRVGHRAHPAGDLPREQRCDTRSGLLRIEDRGLRHRRHRGRPPRAGRPSAADVGRVDEVDRPLARYRPASYENSTDPPAASIAPATPRKRFWRTGSANLRWLEYVPMSSRYSATR